MPKRLIVMRHAKSSWSKGVARDEDRPLNKRGRRDAPRIGKALAKLGWIPELVVSSTATRTRETWERMASRFPDAEVDFSDAFYHEGEGAVVTELVGRAADTIMVLGHNPRWEHLCSTLAGHYIEMTTANAALFECDADDWASAFKNKQWRLETVLRPKELD